MLSVSQATSKFLDQMIFERTSTMIDSVTIMDLWQWRIKFSMKWVTPRRQKLGGRMVFFINEENRKKILKHKPEWNRIVTSFI